MEKTSGVTMEKTAYGGWPNCVRLANGEIELIVTTDVGPRIIRLAFTSERNLLKEWPDQLGLTGGDEWRPYGGHRFWHAPEAQPRTYAPDNSPVEHQWDGNALHLVQPAEPLTGLRKELVVRLDPSRARVSVLHRLTNRNLWAVEAGPWALTVMQGPGRAILPQEPKSNQLRPVRPMVLWGYTDMQDPRWIWGSKYVQLRCDPAAQTAQKVGMMNTFGWAAYYSDGVAMVKRFPFDSGANYPDFGCNTETYTNGDMLEVETLGPLGKIESGATVEHEERWFLFRCEIGEDEASIDERLVPLLNETL